MNRTQAISAGHNSTLEAAELVLHDGGNAFDAAVAAAVTMFNSEPCMSSAAAGGFAMCLHGGKEVTLLDFFTQTPISKDINNLDFYPIHVNFGNEIETFHVGKGSAATPGIIAGLYAMNRRYGSMPMERILEVPLAIAKTGVKVDRFQAIDMGLLEVILAQDKSVRDIFFKDGKLIPEGSLIKMPNLPSFIDMLINEGEDEFYKGEISKVIDKVNKESGGLLMREDFINYQAIWRNPMQYNYNKNKLFVPSAPSLGGAIMLIFFDIIKKNGGRWIEAIKYIKEYSFSTSTLEKEIENRFPELVFKTAQNKLSSKGTSHFNVMDKWGNAVAFTTSIGEGSGYFIPGTDMQLNNMLGEDFLLPEGFHSWEKNKRLNSMMTPVIMTDEKLGFKFAAGSGGASRIPFMISQVISYLMDKNVDLATAIDLPRVILQNNIIQAESGYDLSYEKSNLESKIWDYKSLFFGGVNAISNLNKQTESIGDPRRYGSAKVFLKLR